MIASNSEKQYPIECDITQDKIVIKSGATILANITVMSAYSGDVPTDAFYLVFTPNSSKLHNDNSVYHSIENEAAS